MSNQTDCHNNQLNGQQILNTNSTKMKTIDTKALIFHLEHIEDQHEEEVNDLVHKKCGQVVVDQSVNHKLRPLFAANVKSMPSSQRSNHSLSLSPGISPIFKRLNSFMSYSSSSSVTNDYSDCSYNSIPFKYFDPLGIDSNDKSDKELVKMDEKQTNDIMFLIKQEVYESKEEIIKTLKQTEEHFAEYLQEKEIKFLNALEKAEHRVEQKLNSIASDMKAIRSCIEEIEIQAKRCYSEFETQFEMLHNDNEANHQSFQDCITTLLEIETKLKQNPGQTVEFHKREMFTKFSYSELKSICDPITNQLTQELQTIVQKSLIDFNKMLINEKIMETNGDRNRFNFFDKYSNAEHSTPRQSPKPVTFHLSANKDIESLRSDALDMLNAGNIIQCFAIALNLGEPEFVTHLCSSFEKSPEKLVKELEKCENSQTLIISLLDQLFRDGVTDKKWKIGFIEMLMVRIDMECKATKNFVPKLAKQWSATMAQIYEKGGEFSQRAKLLAISFKFLTEEYLQ